METAIELILSVIGCSLIWAACDVNRPKEYTVKIYSKLWWAQLILIVSGLFLFYLSFK